MPAQRESIYGKRISEFAVGACPDFRRHGTLFENRTPEMVATTSSDQPTSALEDAEQWRNFFAADVRSLAAEIFVHICGAVDYE